MKPDYRPGEERVTSVTGGQKGRKPERFGGGDPLAMRELALVYGMGEQKYDRYNYLKGYPWSLSVDALFRHMFAFLAGENRDEESGLLHTAHVAWHALTLTSFLLREVGEDDRAPQPCFPGSDCRCTGCLGQRERDGDYGPGEYDQNWLATARAIGLEDRDIASVLGDINSEDEFDRSLEMYGPGITRWRSPAAVWIDPPPARCDHWVSLDRYCRRCEEDASMIMGTD